MFGKINRSMSYIQRIIPNFQDNTIYVIWSSRPTSSAQEANSIETMPRAREQYRYAHTCEKTQSSLARTLVQQRAHAGGSEA